MMEVVGLLGMVDRCGWWGFAVCEPCFTFSTEPDSMLSGFVLLYVLWGTRCFIQVLPDDIAAQSTKDVS